MEFRNLTTFMQIVESGSFTKAASVLGYTQSTVSFQIKQLEEELSCSLFDRIGRSIKLTDRGELLLAHAMDIRRSMQKFDEDFRQTKAPEGQVHIVSSDSICEKMMLLNYRNFYKAYPGIKLVFSTGNTEDMLAMLERNEADITFTLDDHVYLQDFIIAKESPVKLHFVAAASSPLAGRGRLHIEDLLEYPFMLTEKGMSYRKILDAKLAQLSMEAEPILETGRTDILASCAEEGNGIAFLPDFVTEKKVREGKLVYLDVEDFDLTIWKQLIYHRNKWLSAPLSAFIEFVKAHEFEW